jgi:formate-dependent nitrite reductase membrane component NrfD
MSEAEVTRDGQQNIRPDAEAKVWAGDGGGAAAPRGGRREHGMPTQPGQTSDSYYGLPIINPPVWEELEIAGYLFTGGLAGGSSMLAAGARATGRPALARTAELTATAAISVSFVALVKDLGRPARFVNMLRVFKPTSPMSVGTWILSAYAPLNYAATAAALTGRAQLGGRVAGAGAGVLGSAVASYTAALIANTAVPAWHEGRRHLPFIFVGSAASAAAGVGMIGAPLRENDPARHLAVLGAAAELLGVELLKGGAGMIGESFESGKAGSRLNVARGLGVAGAVGAATVARRSRLAAVASGAALVAASAFARFGLFAAGMESARDPRYTVEPQRARAAKRRG